MYIFKTVGSAIYNGTFSMYYVSPDERQQTLFPLATSIFADGQIVASLDMSYSSPWKLRVEALLRRDMLQDSDRCSASIWQHDELTDYCAIYFSAQVSLHLPLS